MNARAHNNTIAPNGLAMNEQPAWRQDFPIDWSRDRWIARRDFTKFLIALSLPFALVQVVLAWCNRRRRREQPAARPISFLSDVPIGGAVVFHYPQENDPCLLLRPDEQTLLAFSQKCTHLGCAVTPDMEKKCLVCPCHLGYFALETGRPLAGPPRRPLPRIRLEVRGGIVYATGMEENHA